MTTPVTPFMEVTPEGELRVSLHRGQIKVMQSEARIVAVICSTQWGKTVLGPHWLAREIETEGAGDYLVVTSEYPLLNRVLLPKMTELFVTLLRQYTYKAGARVFESHEKIHGAPAIRIILGSASNPESLESATAKAAWLDEAGQHQFTLQAWEAIQRRLSISQGRVLITSTPYEFGWFKREIYDRWRDGDTEIEVIQGDALDNPTFPREEYERQKTLLPLWKWRMFYQGQFERPAGLIYDAFDEEVCVIARFELPENWPRYVGHDFGPNNTAAVWYAQDPGTGYLYVYRTYHAGGLSAFDHAQKFKALSGDEMILKRVGGSQTEDGWREAFRVAGWPIQKPREREVEVGINIVYGWHQQNKLFVFSDMKEYLDEKMTYSRKLDEAYNPTSVIENKSTFHHLDAERYIISDMGPERALIRRFPEQKVKKDTPQTIISGVSTRNQRTLYI